MTGIHVVHKQGSWVVEQAGGQLGTYPSQDAAIEAGREKAKTAQGELFIHDEQGQIRDRSSFGNDPRGRG